MGKFDEVYGGDYGETDNCNEPVEEYFYDGVGLEYERTVRMGLEHNQCRLGIYHIVQYEVYQELIHKRGNKGNVDQPDNNINQSFSFHL